MKYISKKKWTRAIKTTTAGVTALCVVIFYIQTGYSAQHAFYMAGLIFAVLALGNRIIGDSIKDRRNNR